MTKSSDISRYMSLVLYIKAILMESLEMKVGEKVRFNERCSFSDEESRALWFGARDPASSLRVLRGHKAKLMRWIFGPPQVYAFANERLEMLRRTVVLIHSGRPLAERETAEFYAAGYSVEQLQLLYIMFTPLEKRRGPGRRRHFYARA